MVSASFIITAVLATLVIASPTPSLTTINKLSSRVGPEPKASDVLAALLPEKWDCKTTPPKANCATVAQAAQPLIDAMVKYNIYNVYEISAIIANIAFESLNFTYDINVFPGRAGQGTRNMQMPKFNLMYAQSIPELQAPLAAITTATSVEGLSDEKLNDIRALVLPDKYSWASGAWFYSTQCSNVKAQVQKGGIAGFNAFLSCVGVADPDGGRTARWNMAMKGFGLST